MIGRPARKRPAGQWLTLSQAADRAEVTIEEITEAARVGDLRRSASRRFRADHVDTWAYLRSLARGRSA